MKKYLFVILLTFFINIANADQLLWISLEQATKATDFIKTQKELILFCACCDNATPSKVRVKDAYFHHPTMAGKTYEEYYEVMLKGTDQDGKEVEFAIDLAYVHIKKSKKAYCLGVELGFVCDPCTEPFDWKL